MFIWMIVVTGDPRCSALNTSDLHQPDEKRAPAMCFPTSLPKNLDIGSSNTRTSDEKSVIMLARSRNRDCIGTLHGAILNLSWRLGWISDLNSTGEVGVGV